MSDAVPWVLVRALAFGSLLSLMACAQVWGFQDLTLGPDDGSLAEPDATQPEDDAAAGSDVMDDGTAESRVMDAARPEDAASQSDATSPDSMAATRARPIPDGATPIAGPAKTTAAGP